MGKSSKIKLKKLNDKRAEPFVENGVRLVSQSEYARMTGKSRFLINYHTRKGNLPTRMISGVPYIVIESENDPLSRPPQEAK